MHTTLSLPLWQSHQQLNETTTLAYVKESRWLCWRGGLQGVGSWGEGVGWTVTFRAPLPDRKDKKKRGGKKGGEGYCSQEKMPRSSLWPSKFLAMADIWSGERWRNPLIHTLSYELQPSTKVSLTNRDSNHDHLKHTEIRDRNTQTKDGNCPSFKIDNPSIHMPYAEPAYFAERGEALMVLRARKKT